MKLIERILEIRCEWIDDATDVDEGKIVLAAMAVEDKWTSWWEFAPPAFQERHSLISELMFSDTVELVIAQPVRCRIEMQMKLEGWIIYILFERIFNVHKLRNGRKLSAENESNMRNDRRIRWWNVSRWGEEGDVFVRNSLAPQLVRYFPFTSSVLNWHLLSQQIVLIYLSIRNTQFSLLYFREYWASVYANCHT